MKKNLITSDILGKIEKVNRDCIALHVCPPPVTFIDAEVRDANGNLIDGISMKSNSWVRNMYNLIALNCFSMNTNRETEPFGPGSLRMKKTSGDDFFNNGDYTYSALDGDSSNLFGYVSLRTDSDYGIVVGSSNASESLESIALSALITHGTAGGQLSYAAMAMPQSIAYDSGTKKWTRTVSRVMNNNSGAEIVVKEVGLYAYIKAYTTGAGLLCRDAFAEVDWKTVPDAGQLTVTYTIEMTFPA